MLGRRGMGAFLAAAMMGAFSAGPALADAAPKVMQVPAKATKPGKRGLFNDAVLPKGHSLYGRKGAGIGMAAQQRASGKRRNVKRNRAAHRG